MAKIFTRFHSLVFLISTLLLISSCATTSADNRKKAQLHLQMGISYFESKNYPLALRSLNEAEALDPEDAVIKNNIALTYFMRDRFDLAEKYLRKAIELRPDYTDARNNLARVLIEVNRFSEAEAQIKVVLADLTYGSFEKAYTNLGLIYFNQKRFDKARESFTKAVDARNDDCIANDYLGRSLFELAEYPEAAEQLDTAIGFCQRSSFDEPHYFSALAYFRAGQKAKATSRFEEILKLYPSGKFREKSRAMLDVIKKGTL